MATLGGIIFLFLAFAGIILIIMAAYTMRWSAIEARVRKALEKEFQFRAEEESRKLIQERENRDRRWKKSEEDLAAKMKEVADQTESSIQSGRIQGKQQILQTMNFVIQSLYSSNQTKTKLQAFVNKVQEQSAL